MRLIVEYGPGARVGWVDVREVRALFHGGLASEIALQLGAVESRVKDGEWTIANGAYTVCDGVPFIRSTEGDISIVN